MRLFRRLFRQGAAHDPVRPDQVSPHRFLQFWRGADDRLAPVNQSALLDKITVIDRALEPFFPGPVGSGLHVLAGGTYCHRPAFHVGDEAAYEQIPEFLGEIIGPAFKCFIPVAGIKLQRSRPGQQRFIIRPVIPGKIGYPVQRCSRRCAVQLDSLSTSPYYSGQGDECILTIQIIVSFGCLQRSTLFQEATPAMDDPTLPLVGLSPVFGKRVDARFDGGLSSPTLLMPSNKETNCSRQAMRPFTSLRPMPASAAIARLWPVNSSGKLRVSRIATS